MARYSMEDNVFMSPTSNQQNSMATTFQSTPVDASLELAEPNRRKQHFRSLVSDIAEHLDARDVDKIIWQKELPQKMKDKPALAVLEWLYSHGDYSMDEVRPLAQLLKAIHREDITEKVESYQEKFGRHSSLPLNSPKPSLSIEKRANTLSGGQSTTDIDQNGEKSPHQETGHDEDTDIHSANSSRSQNGFHNTSLSASSVPPTAEVPAVGDEALLYSPKQQQFHEEAHIMISPYQSHDQMNASHDQMNQSHEQLPQSHDRTTRGQRMPKQMSFDQIEAAHPMQTVMETHQMHRSSSSTAPVRVVRPVDTGHSTRSTPLHGNNRVSSDLLLNHNIPIHGQLAWKFNSNPSSSNVSQENILASSSHSDVNIHESSPRPPVQAPPPPHGSNHRLRNHSSSNPLSQELQVLLHNQSSPSDSHHAMNRHIINPSFHVGASSNFNFNEAVFPGYTTQRSCPVHRTHSGLSLSQGSGGHYCAVVQPCTCHDHQQYVLAPNNNIISNGYQSQEHGNSTPHIQHQHSYSYNCAMDSRSVSRTSMRQPPPPPAPAPSSSGMTTTTTVQPGPPQIFPTAYPSTQNIAQQQLLSSLPLTYTPPRHSRQHPAPPTTRHLSLVATQQDHPQFSSHGPGPGAGGHMHVPQRSSGYTTDGSGPDDVFQSYPEDHLLSVTAAAPPERSSTHPQTGGGGSRSRSASRPQLKQRARTSQDALSSSDHMESAALHRKTPAGGGGGGYNSTTGTRGSEMSMEMPPYVGPSPGGGGGGNSAVEKSGSKHAWDVMTSQSGDLNDADSGFIGSAPHGINGETGRRSFTPSMSAKLSTELKKLPLSQPSLTTNSVSGFNSYAPGAEGSSSSQKSKAKKKRQSSRTSEQENRLSLHEDPPSDDNIPVVYKDDDESWKSSTVKRSKDRAIMRGAVQYRSLRYERDRQIQRRGKPNRSSLQSFDGNTLDSLQLERAGRMKHSSSKSPGTSANGHGSAHSLKSKSSQDTLTNILTCSTVPRDQQGRSLQPGVSGHHGHHHYQHTKDENGSPSVSSKHTARSGGPSTKSSKSTTSHSQSSKAPPDTDSPDSIPHSARGTTTTTSHQPKKSKFGTKLHRRSKPKIKLIRPDELSWPIKRDKLNKYIYESKYAKKPLQCKQKLELESETGIGSCPKLKFELYPFGLEEDENEYVTIKVYVEQPKHCHLHSSTEIQMTLNIFDCESGDQIGEPYIMYESIRSSYFLIKRFVHHDLIKKCRCDYIEVTIQACLVVASEESNL